MFNNFRYKIIALGLAALFWVFIVATSNTINKYPQKIPVEVFNLSEKLGISNSLESAEIIIQATPEAFKTVAPGDFTAYVDAKGLFEGEYTLPVVVTSKNPNITILKITPSFTTIFLKPLDQKSVPIKIAIQGKPALFYRAGDPVLQHTSVKASGAADLVPKITEARAIITLSGNETSNLNRNVVLQAVNQEGKIVDTISLDPKTVDVFLPIVQTIQSKTVLVQAAISKFPVDGKIAAIEVKPSTVIVTGEEPILSGLDVITTEPIVLEKETGTITRSSSLALPSGVSLLKEEDKIVTVTIEITPIIIKKQINIPVRLLNNPENLRAEPSTIQATIEGPQSEIQKIQETDGALLIDLAGTTKDEISIRKEYISLPSTLSIVSFSPQKIILIH